MAIPKDKRRDFARQVRNIIREEMNRVEPHVRPDWLTTEQVANLLQICSTTLEKARSTGVGPFSGLVYHKIGRSVRYRRTDIEAFMLSKKIPVSKKIHNFSGEMLSSNVREREK